MLFPFSETTFDLQDLFPKSPEITKSLDMFLDEMPAIMEHVLTWSNSRQVLYCMYLVKYCKTRNVCERLILRISREKQN